MLIRVGISFQNSRASLAAALQFLRHQQIVKKWEIGSIGVDVNNLAYHMRAQEPKIGFFMHQIGHFRDPLIITKANLYIKSWPKTLLKQEVKIK